MVKRLTSLLAIVLPSIVLQCATVRGRQLDLWPQPSEASSGTTTRYVSPSFDIRAPTCLEQDVDFAWVIEETLRSLHTHAVESNHHTKVEDVNEEAIESLEIELVSVDGQSKRHQIALSSSDACKETTSLRSLVTAPLELLDEWYSLDVSDVRKTVILRAHNALGALRGLATFKQLTYRTERRNRLVEATAALCISHLPIHVDDRPAFPYRGVMLDTARNYLSPEVIKRQMDVMALVKLNQLHWHVTDTSSWPLALRTHGMHVLAQAGAYSADQIYDAEAIRDLVTYGVRRGVNVILEIDMPGHQYMGVQAYAGDLIVCADQTDWQTWGNEPPTGHLDVRKPAATELMKDVLSEVLVNLPGKYVSTGNDEVNARCYGLKDGDVNGTDVLLAPFVESVHGHIASLDKMPMVWEEAALTFPYTAAKLRQGTLVEAWTGSNNVARILSNDKLRLVHAPSDYFYLDCGMGSFLTDDVDGQSWCMYVSWQKQYSFDPYNGTQTIPNGGDRVMGGESALWAEQVDEANVEQMLWPRAASGAEVFWTGARYMLDGHSYARDIKQAVRRMQSVRQRMRAMGIGASPLQPAWCAKRPGRCGLSH